MSLLEELAGAAAAVMAVKKLDPNAGLLEEGIAAYAGVKGVEAVTEHLEKTEEAQGGAAPQA